MLLRASRGFLTLTGTPMTSIKVTIEEIEALIMDEYFFTGLQAVKGTMDMATDSAADQLLTSLPSSVKTLTVCVLVLENGYSVVGMSNCIDPSNFNKETGRRIARENAVNEIWPLLGYQKKQEIYDKY